MPPKQDNAVKRWCFTLNNPTDDELDLLSTLVPAVCNFLIFGRELAPGTGKWKKAMRTPSFPIANLFRRRYAPLPGVSGASQASTTHRSQAYPTAGTSASRTSQGLRRR